MFEKNILTHFWVKSTFSEALRQVKKLHFKMCNFGIGTPKKVSHKLPNVQIVLVKNHSTLVYIYCKTMSKHFILSGKDEMLFLP